MTTFRLGLVLAAGAAMQFGAASLPAVAADLPVSYKDTPYVVMPWQGLYFGGHAGGVWGSAGVHDQFDYSGDPILNGSASSTGFIGGAQAGYNFQRGHAVFGVEGDIGYLGVSATGSDFYDNTLPGGHKCTVGQSSGKGDECSIGAKYNTSGDLYGDLTARLGYAADRTLFYVKGGVAFLNVDESVDYAGHNCTYTGNYGCSKTKLPSLFHSGGSDTLAGWTAGAGVEYALTPSWSLKGEYQHFDFGSMSYATNNLTTPVPGKPCYTSTLTNGKTDVSVTADAVKFGINYHLTGADELK
jgi:outer membrane immunogenic protein